MIKPLLGRDLAEVLHERVGVAAPAKNAAEPVVSILIPVRNRLDLTRQCLASIDGHAAKGLATEILVIDDASDDGTPQWLAEHRPDVRVIRNGTAQGFARNMNRAAAAAAGEFLCLLNNDTLVTEDWLSAMLAVARHSPDVGVVGNKHLWPDSGLVNHAGMVFDEDRLPTHLYPGARADAPQVNVSRDFQILTAACWLVPADLFRTVGGFDERFVNGFEDVDFCLRVREHGRRVHYCHESVIYHYGQSSPGRKDNDDRNLTAFQAKWREAVHPDLSRYFHEDGLVTLEQHGFKAPAAPPVHSGRSADQARLHLDIPMDVPNSFTWVVAALADALHGLEIPVSLRPGGLHRRSADPRVRKILKAMMRQTASERASVRWTHYDRAYREPPRHAEITAEVFVTNYAYGRRQVHELDNWMRHVALNHHRKLPVSRFAHERLMELGVPASRSRVVPHGFSPEVLTATGSDDRYADRGKVFLAIVNSHDHTRVGTDLLLKAWAEAFRPGEDVVLVLKDYGLGADPAPLRRMLADMGPSAPVVHFTEWQTKDELVRMYRGADAFVAPFRGEGFGMKVLDAVACGLPVIAPDFGGPSEFLLPGMYCPVNHELVPVADCFDTRHGVVPEYARWAQCDTHDLARQMRRVADDPDEAHGRADRGRDYVLANYSWRAAARKLVAALDDFERQRDGVVAGRAVAADRPRKKCTVLIPTYNRPQELGMCLAAYDRQTTPKDDFEVVLVDDGSSYAVADLVGRCRGGLDVNLLHAGGNGGPAAARNRGIAASTGETVLITGDDVIPEPDMVARHLEFHQRHPAPTTAMLGYLFWHRDLAVSPLMEFVTGAGGHQFNYERLRPGTVGHGFFYTSNVSVKRELLTRQETMFSTAFRLAAFEDVELALRLERAGMSLVYNPTARGAHHHPMSDEQIMHRQYKVGRMQAVHAAQHPDRLDAEQTELVHWLQTCRFLMPDAGARPHMAAALAGLGAFWSNVPAAAAEMLSTWSPEMAPPQAAAVMAPSAAHWRRLRNAAYTRALGTAQLAGWADEWAGVGQGEPNPMRDFLLWKLIVERGEACSQWTPPPMRVGGERMLRLARRVRHHPRLRSRFDRLVRSPRYETVKHLVHRVLYRMP